MVLIILSKPFLSSKTRRGIYPKSNQAGKRKALLLIVYAPEFLNSSEMSIKFACKSFSSVPPTNIIPYLNFECKNCLQGIIVAFYLLISLIVLTIPSSLLLLFSRI